MNTTYEGSNRLMFITNRTDQYTEQQETQWVLEGGCRWIQLRMKDNPSLETARELVKLCAPYQARLCIDDDVQMALESGATAVHLGKNDMPVDQACELVHQSGKTDFLIGATANTFEDICHAARLGASYIGLGPFRFTQTKKKLSPILGLDGYKRILEQCRVSGITLPVYAIGGIEIEDIPALMRTGITGIAISGTIIRAKNPVQETRNLIETILSSL